ncbi:MAG: DNA-processing protein DprA [Candidatus Brocadiia bacterium]
MNENMTRLEYLLTINSVSGIGSVLYERLISHLGSIENIADASVSHIASIPRMGRQRAEQVKEAFKDEMGKREMELAGKYNIKIISCEDDNYPENLKNIFDYPLVLYVKGAIKEVLSKDGFAIGMVGSRRATLYGEAQASRLSYALAEYGFCIVSGLARGVDAASHNGCLKCKSGYTVAVLGNGLSRIYPPEHKKLSERIIESGGALISELPIQSPPLSQNFPARNRIISGLSLGVVVVEAPLKSGALITADLALDQGREIFAVPGKIDSPFSHGCHKLIKQGAKLVENVDDILDEITLLSYSKSPAADKAIAARNRIARKPLDYKEELIISKLTKDEPRHIDDIIDASGLPAAIISSMLLTMELKQLVRQIPGKGYVLRYE